MKKKLFHLLIIAVFFIVLSYFIINSFGLFQTEGIGIVNQSVGKWIVKINDVDITKNTEFTVDNIKYFENSKVASNKIAPNSEGYFDLVIDPSGSDVAVKYDIIFNFEINEIVPSLQINVEDLTGGKIIKTGVNQYTGVINLDEIKAGTTNTLRVKVKWLNDENNNDYDSSLGTTENSKISFPIQVKAVQYMNETITPYNG